MANIRPPDLTIRYKILTKKIPSDLSNSFFARTQVPHTKCFLSGPYVIVGVASEADREKHTTPESNKNLSLLGFELVESPKDLCARTILARRLDSYLLTKTADDLREEIQTRNNVTIEDIRIIPKHYMLKIRFQTKNMADNTTNKGIKLFSQIIPSYNINIEEYLPVLQCYKCYKFDHRSNQCKEQDNTCSKCAAKGHDYKSCQSTTQKCVNCEGEHTAVSFKCPIKRAEQKQQNTHGTPPPTSNNSYAQATSASTATPATTNTQKTTTNNNTTSTNNEKLLLADIIIKYSIETSFGDLKKQTETMNELLAYNGCPIMKFPPTFTQKNQQHYQTHYTQTQPENTTQPEEESTPSPPSPGELVINEDTASGESQPPSPRPSCSASSAKPNTIPTTQKGATIVKRHLLPQPETPQQRYTRNTTRKTVKT